MIIVTGGAGFIGSAIVWKLNQLGRDDILVVDHLGHGDKWKNLVALRFTDYLEKDEFLRQVISGELCDFANGEFEAIIHMGACSSTTETDASYLIRNNFEYTKHLALFAIRNDARFIYASSAATYGDGSNGFSETESKETRPLNMYGYSKQLFDNWVMKQSLRDKIVGLKYFNVFGPNEYHKGDMRSVAVKGFGQIVSTGGIRLFKSHKNEYADGEQARDFIYVKDAADMTIHFLNNAGAGGIYNIGSGIATTWNALAGSIFAALDKPARIEYIDMPEAIRDKYQYYTCADISGVRHAGYDRPITPIGEAIDDYVKKYLTHDKRLGE